MRDGRHGGPAIDSDWRRAAATGQSAFGPVEKAHGQGSGTAKERMLPEEI